VHDPIAQPDEAMHEYGVELTAWGDLPPAAAMVAAVSHKQFVDMSVPALAGKLAAGGVFVDVKSAYDRAALEAAGLQVWRL
jgi:UDP-N-acetyl-D-galactosamine dehydrogenase